MIGLGRFGTAVAERLYALGNEVLVIDDDAERVQRMESRVTYAVVADARDEAVLRSLGMRNYDCAIVAIGSDLAASIVITMNLKELGVPQVICKAEGDMQKRALEKIGADKVLIPEREAGVKLAQAVHVVEHPRFHRAVRSVRHRGADAPGGVGRQDDPRAEHPRKVWREHYRCARKRKDQRRAGRGRAAARGLRAGGGRGERQADEAEGMREERITSRQNPLLRHAKKLLTSRSYRESCGEFAADGTKLLEEAARWVPGLHTVIAADGVELCRLPEEVRVVRVPRDVMASVSQMDAPQGAIFLCRTPQPPQAEILPGTLLLDGIQDPGNLGTILRTADALAVPVVLLPGCADVWNPKVVRASMGAAFRAVPVAMTREAAVASCRSKRCAPACHGAARRRA